MVLGAFLDSFQKIADAATNTKGKLAKDIQIIQYLSTTFQYPSKRTFIEKKILHINFSTVLFSEKNEFGSQYTGIRTFFFFKK